MDTSRISELLRPFLAAPLNASQLAQISTYIDLLLRWNARINLTAVRDPDAIVTRHFGESLFAARHLLFPDASLRPLAPAFETFDSAPSRTLASQQPEEDLHCLPRPLPGTPKPKVVDVGSGAGFPGVPLKIFDPAIRLTLLESNQKKVAFLREVVRALSLTDVDVSPSRAEHFPPATARLVTLRAVEHFEAILPAAARLVAPEGRLALLIASAQIPKAIKRTPSLRWQDPIPTPLSDNGILLIGVCPPRSRS
ncbi:MAG TPA: 16S rRNA (guanine(527)-N(7))-methyltransferase RsmG [Terriglobales bacterium]|nr:16S rRNA (guanine(527)-N(7))-methyltransferase RsmG [Terriglobales bacterium]